MTTVRDELISRLPVADRRLDVAGVPTAVLVGGEGPPLVLLHGQGEFAATWLRVIPDLATRHALVIPDLPGHGASDLGNRRLSRDRVLAWLDDLIRQTCRTPPIVVGHLLGGAIAARFAVRGPERIDRLVLVDTLGLRWYRPTLGFGAAMASFVARPTERSRDRMFDRCFVDLGGLRAQIGHDMDLLGAYALERARTPQLKAALRALMPRLGIPPIHAHDLTGLSTPTSLVWGREDEQTPLSAATTASDRYGWPLWVVEDAADDPAHEQPTRFLEALAAALDHLATHPEPPRSRT